MRIAAPFVVPLRPASAGSAPAASAASARFVDGPSSPTEPALAHRRLPRHEPSAQLAGVDAAARLDHLPPKERRLLGVVGDRARREPRGERVTGRPRVEAVDEHAVALHDLRARRRLGRHPERVPDREPVQGTAGPVPRHSAITARRRSSRPHQRPVEGEHVERWRGGSPPTTPAQASATTRTAHPGVGRGDRRGEHAAVGRDPGRAHRGVAHAARPARDPTWRTWWRPRSDRSARARARRPTAARPAAAARTATRVVRPATPRSGRSGATNRVNVTASPNSSTRPPPSAGSRRSRGVAHGLAGSANTRCMSITTERRALARSRRSRHASCAPHPPASSAQPCRRTDDRARRARRGSRTPRRPRGRRARPARAGSPAS